MSSSSEEPAAYQHPRWLVRCATIGFVLLYVCSLFVANILPHGDQRHGWPFVYMVRQWRVPGPFTIMYGPWPFDDPPIVQFRPILLGLNCLIGVLLTVFAAIVPAYWFRVRQRPVQFSLQTLFVATTLVACLLALLKYCYPEQIDHFNIWSALEIALVSSFLLVYVVVPACMALTAAHWLVVRSAQFRPAGAVVGTPLAHLACGLRGWRSLLPLFDRCREAPRVRLAVGVLFCRWVFSHVVLSLSGAGRRSGDLVDGSAVHGFRGRTVDTPSRAEGFPAKESVSRFVVGYRRYDLDCEQPSDRRVVRIFCLVIRSRRHGLHVHCFEGSSKNQPARRNRRRGAVLVRAFAARSSRATACSRLIARGRGVCSDCRRCLLSDPDTS